ncbi:MAG: hypothetical protein M5U34_31610 [Chloroflexi bacterium]|nr:hypothetical protein [Chloroflexota bacterium]
MIEGRYWERRTASPEEGVCGPDEQVVLTAETMQSLAPKHWQNARFGYGLYADGRPENGFTSALLLMNRRSGSLPCR